MKKKAIRVILCLVSLIFLTGCGKKQLLTEHLIEKANQEEITKYEDGKKSEMYIFNHDKTEQTDKKKSYRYIGNEPNNYIEFNGETWRIIGVFTEKNLQKVKIIKEDSIDEFSWDDEYNYGKGYNNWESSTLHYVLDSYESSIDYTYLDGKVQNYKTADFSKIGLKEVKKYISAEYYYLGGVPYENHGDGNNLYNLERSNKVHGSNPKQTITSIGLMYPSDFAYTFADGVNDICYNDLSGCTDFSASWLKYIGEEWLISPSYDNSKAVFAIDSSYVRTPNDESRTEYYAKYSCNVRPVLYLDTDVKVSDGDGTEDNPYILAK